MMQRTTFLVDGFNLYHSIKDLQRDFGIRTKWLNIRDLCVSLLPLIDKHAGLQNIYYFSAYATHLNDPEVLTRHQNYVSCLEDTGIIAIISRFKAKTIRCPSCGTIIIRHEEKETDVAIAAKLLELFARNACENVVLVTGDTDLVPAVKCARQLFSGCQVFVAFPYGRKNKELAQLTHSFKIGRARYMAHQFPDPFILKDGTHINKPNSW